VRNGPTGSRCSTTLSARRKTGSACLYLCCRRYSCARFVGHSPGACHGNQRVCPRSRARIDAASAEAHLGAAFVRWFFEWDWRAAEQEYQRALQLNPSLADAWATYGQMLALEGRDSESTEKLAHALELDPLSLPLIYMAGESHYYGRRYDQALRLCRKIEDMNPGFQRVNHLVAMILLEQRMYADAIRAITSNMDRLGRRVPQPALLGYAYAVSGANRKPCKSSRHGRQLLPIDTFRLAAWPAYTSGSETSNAPWNGSNDACRNAIAIPWSVSRRRPFTMEFALSLASARFSKRSVWIAERFSIDNLPRHPAVPLSLKAQV